MTTCPACTLAATDPRTGHQQAGCLECQARAIAGSPAAWRALHAQTAVELQQAIERVFGVEGYEDGRRRVWAWIKRINKAPRKSPISPEHEGRFTQKGTP